MIIAVNSGHCPGLDSGAVGKHHTEAELVRSVGQALCYELEAAGHEPFFIQEDELSDITDAANDAEADIFISIHCNACNGSARGTETFFYQYGDASYRLAQRVQSELVNTLGTIDRGVKIQNDAYPSGLYVINHTDMPAILTELGFIDNRDEEELLASRIIDIAKAICRGVKAHIAQEA